MISLPVSLSAAAAAATVILDLRRGYEASLSPEPSE